ncbi:hypothetical protein LINPERPRIM_LOCUS1538 [Linum perenne]
MTRINREMVQIFFVFVFVLSQLLSVCCYSCM